MISKWIKLILSDTVIPNAEIHPEEIILIPRKCFILKVIDHNVVYKSKDFKIISMNHHGYEKCKIPIRCQVA